MAIDLESAEEVRQADDEAASFDRLEQLGMAASQ
jgi:hypothetical protein